MTPDTSAHIQTLTALLAPQGIKTVTTGSDEIGAFLRLRYGSAEAEAVQRAWRMALERVGEARAIVVGVPSDCGAGFERGSFKGPLGVRTRLYHAPGVREALERAGVVDVGDVRVNAHMLDDGMYRDETLQQVRAARGLEDAALPVAPHSALARVLEVLRQRNPDARVLVIGGDHSISRVPVDVLTRAGRNDARDLGVVHFDAHTDLLSQRDGTDYTFATWAWHANEAIGRGDRMQQLGLRVSGKTAAQWKALLDVTQLWADVINADEDAAIRTTLDNLARAGVRRVYLSNDIDATDPRWAASTGTMEPDGITPAFITRTIEAVAERFEIVGADLMEVAPPLKWHVPGEPARTLATAAHYALVQLDAMLGLRGVDRLAPLCPPPAPATREAVLARPSWLDTLDS